jgi:hypothetical protein
MLPLIIEHLSDGVLVARCARENELSDT